MSEYPYVICRKNSYTNKFARSRCRFAVDPKLG